VGTLIVLVLLLLLGGFVAVGRASDRKVDRPKRPWQCPGCKRWFESSDRAFLYGVCASCCAKRNPRPSEQEVEAAEKFFESVHPPGIPYREDISLGPPFHTREAGERYNRSLGWAVLVLLIASILFFVLKLLP